MTVMMPGAWRCELHRLWTTGDCPDCDGPGDPTLGPDAATSLPC